MNTRQHLRDIYSHLRKNEKLIRLLHYKPKNAFDDPLDSNKDNLIDSPIIDDILAASLVPSDKKFDLTTTAINRICLYNGNRKPQYNYYSHDQDFVFDIYVHVSFDEIDYRLSWICDTLDELLSNNDVTGAGKMKFVMAHPIKETPNQWIGFKMVYKVIGIE